MPLQKRLADAREDSGDMSSKSRCRLPLCGQPLAPPSQAQTRLQQNAAPAGRLPAIDRGIGECSADEPMVVRLVFPAADRPAAACRCVVDRAGAGFECVGH